MLFFLHTTAACPSCSSILMITRTTVQDTAVFERRALGVLARRRLGRCQKTSYQDDGEEKEDRSTLTEASHGLICLCSKALVVDRREFDEVTRSMTDDNSMHVRERTNSVLISPSWLNPLHSICMLCPPKRNLVSPENSASARKFPCCHRSCRHTKSAIKGQFGSQIRLSQWNF